MRTIMSSPEPSGGSSGSIAELGEVSGGVAEVGIGRVAEMSSGESLDPGDSEEVHEAHESSDLPEMAVPRGMGCIFCDTEGIAEDESGIERRQMVAYKSVRGSVDVYWMPRTKPGRAEWTLCREPSEQRQVCPLKAQSWHPRTTVDQKPSIVTNGCGPGAPQTRDLQKKVVVKSQEAADS